MYINRSNKSAVNSNLFVDIHDEVAGSGRLYGMHVSDGWRMHKYVIREATLQTHGIVSITAADESDESNTAKMHVIARAVFHNIVRSTSLSIARSVYATSTSKAVASFCAAQFLSKVPRAL